MRFAIFMFMLLSSIQGCKSTNKNGSNAVEMEKEKHKYTNKLISETSPYLLQHAHNPVDWYPWGDEALAKAQAEDKLLLISIGYSACHWCHVMEHESFEDTSVAQIMNENFICVKVDREERPDVDQVYMNAVQLMTQQGGWPLNCFALPDGRPVYGGTYYPKDQWIQILTSLSEDYKSNKEKFLEYAEKLTEGVQQSELIRINREPAIFKLEVLNEMVNKWSKNFDSKEGGSNRAPKFPLPNNYDFLMQYAHLTDNEDVLQHVELTLDKMALGGIYDQIGGGFARYSTDVLWKAPHFEKMLYDNGQLIELYSNAYQKFGKQLYKDVVYQSIEFIQRELTSEEGAFYSALDADSEGEEGKFYVWTEEELQRVLGEDYPLAKEYYNVGKKGKWEHNNNILLRSETEDELVTKFNLSKEELREKMHKLNAILLNARSKRIRPGLDDKTLTSWNAITVKGLARAYEVFGEKSFLDMAIKNALFIKNKQLRQDGGLNHSYKNGQSTINGYLEDYCFSIEAFLRLYQVTFDPSWLELSKTLSDYVIEHFYDSESGMFYFTSNLDKALIARKMEVHDNVIPASNSSMAKALFQLGHFFDNKAYLNISATMLNNVNPQMASYGSGYSNWGQLYLQRVYPFYEIAISGNQLDEKVRELSNHFIPNKMLIGAKEESSLPLMEDKYVEGETFIYVCVNKACKMPVTSVSEALKQMD